MFLYKVRVKSMRNSFFSSSSKNRFIIHRFCIPHHNFWRICAPIVYKGHQISIVFRYCVFFFMKKYFTSCSCWTKSYVFNNMLILKIILYKSSEIHIVLCFLGIWDSFMKLWNITISSLITHQLLRNHGKISTKSWFQILKWWLAIWQVKNNFIWSGCF